MNSYLLLFILPTVFGMDSGQASSKRPKRKRVPGAKKRECFVKLAPLDEALPVLNQFHTAVATDTVKPSPQDEWTLGVVKDLVKIMNRQMYSDMKHLHDDIDHLLRVSQALQLQLQTARVVNSHLEKQLAAERGKNKQLESEKITVENDLLAKLDAAQKDYNIVNKARTDAQLQLASLETQISSKDEQIKLLQSQLQVLQV